LSGAPGTDSRRLLGILAAAVCALALPSVCSASSIAGLQAANARIAAQSHAAVLDLYSLDSQIANAQARLDGIRAQEQALRSERAVLATELRFARRDARLSQQRIAMRVRFLYDHGTTSTLELFFGARSLADAVSELDDYSRVMSVNDDVLQELQLSETRLTQLTHRLTGRQLSLDAAARQAASVAAELEQSRSERAGYVSQLEAQSNANLASIGQLEAEAQAAERRAQSLPAPTVSPVALATSIVSTTVAPAVASGARTLTVSSTGYSLPGRTATGLPVGWGVVAVDPSVIPLGTHLMIPGYGEAVAADTGSAVIGDDIDLWFPSLAQAQAWGRRSVTISLN
jgi:3D (Asp-Asp-Asp) domain-containing protein